MVVWPGQSSPDPFAGEHGQQRYLNHVAGFTEDDTRGMVDRLSEVAVPTSLIWGAEDEDAPAAVIKALHAALAPAELRK